MVGIAALWLPILLSAVLVFLVSSVIHMMSPWHKNDYPLLPNQDQVMDALRPLNIPPGDYFVPRPASREDMRSAAHLEKVKRGPVVVFTVMPQGGVNIGKNLIGWFVYLIVVGCFAAYVAGRALHPGAPYLSVFRFVGVTAFLAYTLALWQMSIWYARSYLTSFKVTVDGLIYALLTAGMFGWLWPK
ncbi:MAG TPA: hypothetical protein VH113_09915 [Gemmatimonadales bacterium]|nr:hypothetical protein [Gemmatimonadales bacterium]